MNTSLVKAVPQGDFVEVSALFKGWETRFQMLVSQNRSIKYDMYPMSGIPPELIIRLQAQGYEDLVLESDRWQHFLVPDSDSARNATFGSWFSAPSKKWKGSGVKLER